MGERDPALLKGIEAAAEDRDKRQRDHRPPVFLARSPSHNFGANRREAGNPHQQPLAARDGVVGREVSVYFV